jgi:ribosomal protein S18 acetylase RimI-like enzyme
VADGERVRPGFIVEPALPADADAIADIQRIAWLNTYVNQEAGITLEDVSSRFEGEQGDQKRENWRAIVESDEPHRAIYVARGEEGRILGYVAARINSRGRATVGSLYVLPEAQGSGIGSKLMERALAWFSPDADVWLEVVSYNHRAVEFYKRLGFEIAGEAPGVELPGGKTLPKVAMVLRQRGGRPKAESPVQG